MEAVGNGAADDPGEGDRPAAVRQDHRQALLPTLRVVLRPAPEAEFAHPFERDFARLLTYYRVRWAYEPTSFALAWAADGRPTEMFTPDFYLPDHRLYVELTTMRQRLVTRKHRKLRRLRELYPGVRVKLLYRRDYHRLVAAARCPPPRGEDCRVGRVLWTAEAIRARVDDLAARIVAEQPPAGQAGGGDGPLLVVGVGAGARPFLDGLGAALDGRGVAWERDRVELTRFRSPAGARHVRLRRGPQVPVAGRRVLLVVDAVSTGCSLAYLVGRLRRRGAARVEVCALLDRRGARLVEVPLRHVAFEAPDELLVGFGLSLRRQFRNLPYLAALDGD